MLRFRLLEKLLRDRHTARLTELNTSDATEGIASEIVFRLGIQTMKRKERMIAVGEKRNLHPVFYQRDVPD